MKTLLLAGGVVAGFLLLRSGTNPAGYPLPATHNPGTNLPTGGQTPAHTFNGVPVDDPVYAPNSPQARAETARLVAERVERDRQALIALLARQQAERENRNAATRRAFEEATARPGTVNTVNPLAIRNLENTLWSSITTRSGQINAVTAWLNSIHDGRFPPNEAQLAYVRRVAGGGITTGNLARNAEAIGYRQGNYQNPLSYDARDAGFTSDAEYYAWLRTAARD